MLERIFLKLYICLEDMKSCVISLLRDKSASAKIPKRILDELARCLLPDIIAFYESPEGRKAYDEWEACPNSANATGRSTAPLKAKFGEDYLSVLPGIMRQK